MVQLDLTSTGFMSSGLLLVPGLNGVRPSRLIYTFLCSTAAMNTSRLIPAVDAFKLGSVVEQGVFGTVARDRRHRQGGCLGVWMHIWNNSQGLQQRTEEKDELDDAQAS